MTFLTTRYRLKKPLSEKELERLARLHTMYGIRGMAIEDDWLAIEYDASRIHEAEVLAAVRQQGLAVEPQRPIAPGAFDSQGEFRDFAWPTTGLSPANQKQMT
jgi:hypothetical protein